MGRDKSRLAFISSTDSSKRVGRAFPRKACLFEAYARLHGQRRAIEIEETCPKADWEMDLAHTLVPVVAMIPEGMLGSLIKRYPEGGPVEREGRIHIHGSIMIQKGRKTTIQKELESRKHEGAVNSRRHCFH